MINVATLVTCVTICIVLLGRGAGPQVPAAPKPYKAGDIEELLTDAIPALIVPADSPVNGVDTGPQANRASALLLKTAWRCSRRKAIGELSTGVARALAEAARAPHCH
jgi:hypothetical protein